MQGGGLARACGPTHVEQAIGFADGFYYPLAVVDGQAQFVHGDGLAPGQNAHNHVFYPACAGDGGDPQLNIEGTVFFELDFAVLGVWAAERFPIRLNAGRASR